MASCGRRTAQVRVARERAEVAEALGRFVRYRLEPARVAPPTVSPVGGLVIDSDVHGVARLVQAEDQIWNDWPGESVRLLNNTVAHWFQIDVKSTEGLPLRWMPLATTLELNEPGNNLRAAASQEELLEELLFFAYQQERHVLDGDLVERVRGSGQLRNAYIDMHASHLQGLVAFPLHLGEGAESFLDNDGPPADYHVVSMRLTVAIDTPRGPRELVWLFD